MNQQSTTNQTSSPDSRPFAGVRVVEVSRVIASPFTGSQLAYLGAEIIKIEDPGKGDGMRIRNGSNKELIRKGMSPSFLSQNAGKRSVTLNMRTPEGQKIFRQLAANANVVLENLKTGTMHGYGLGYEDLRASCPRLVYCSLTAYGNTGPRKRYPAYDPVVQAGSGMMSINGTPESGPIKVGPSVVDYGTGFAAAFAIASALFQRERTGAGQHIDVSMMDTALVLMGQVASDVLTSGTVPRLQGNINMFNPTTASFPTKQGELFIGAMEEHQVQNMFRALGRADLSTDVRFSSTENRNANGAALRAELIKTFQGKAATEWEHVLNEANVPAMPVRTIPEALADPHLKSRNLFQVFDKIPGISGSATVPLVPFMLSESKARADLPPPTLGAHTREVLASLGYSDAQIEQLHMRHVI